MAQDGYPQEYMYINPYINPYMNLVNAKSLPCPLHLL